jgi:hypothetical protein
LGRFLSDRHTLQLLQARDFQVLGGEVVNVALKVLWRVPCMFGESVTERLKRSLVPVVAQEGWKD